MKNTKVKLVLNAFLWFFVYNYSVLSLLNTISKCNNLNSTFYSAFLNIVYSMDHLCSNLLGMLIFILGDFLTIRNR